MLENSMRRHTVQKKQFLAVIISSCAKIDIPHLEASKSLAKSCHYFKYHSFSTWEYFSSQWSKMPLKNLETSNHVKSGENPVFELSIPDSPSSRDSKIIKRFLMPYKK